MTTAAVLSVFIAMATVGSSTLPPLQIVWIVPFTSHPRTTSFVYNASSSVAALALGLDTIKNLKILVEYAPNVTVIDSECNSKQSLGRLVELISQIDIDLVIGPPCAHVVETIGELMAYRDIPVINWVSLSQTIDSKADLNTYVRTMAPIASLGGIMTYFYYYTGWRRFVLISSAGANYEAGAQTIRDNLALHKSTGFLIAHHYSDVHRNTTSLEIDNILGNVKHEGRIIILVIPRSDLRKYMLRAHALGMTSGDYQFLFTETTLASADDIEIINSDVLWRQNDDNDNAARQAFENVLIFLLGHNTTSLSQWSGVANTSYYNQFAYRSDVPHPSDLDQYASYLHDAIVLYALALNTSLAENDTGSGTDIFQHVRTSHFKGLSGDVVINYNGDRQPSFFVYDLNSDGIFHQVASLLYAINPLTNKVSVSSSFTTIIWGDGTMTPDIPSDIPVCGFFDEFCPPSAEEDNTLLIGLAVSIPMLVVMLVLYLMFRWWRWERDLKNMAWKINPGDLDYSMSKRAHSSSIGRSTARTMSFGSHSSAEGIPNRSVGVVSVSRDVSSAPKTQIFTEIARYNDEIVAVKKSNKRKLTMDRAFLLDMKHMMAMKHGNLTNFIGVCTTPEKICSVWEYCNKGSLQDVIENDDIRLDTMFKMSMALDICQGLDYIHKSQLKFHGNLRSSNCVIDSRWVCKLTDFGLKRLAVRPEIAEIGEHAYYASLFWTSPEMLSKILGKEACSGSHEADIYALGVILKELMCRNEPYCAYPELSPKEIIFKVAYPHHEDGIFRPGIQECELGDEFRRQNMEYLIHRCWAQDPDDRPHVKAVLRTINKLNPFKKASVVDNMIAMMEKYTNNLEDIVAERTEQLQDEKRKTDALLYRMLPKKVAEDLKFGRSVQAEAFDSVTIYFSDIVRFTDLASQSTPLQIVDLLNSLYTLFDDIIGHYDVYKVETIGDAYMVVSGLPERNGPNHVKEIAGVALDILNSVLTFKIPHDHNRQLQIRIGLHTGSVVAGVVGLTMPRYCLFGDTVNTASRMESNGQPQKIHISSETNSALKQFSDMVTEERGEIPIKGKGMMRTHWLTGRCSSGKDMQKSVDECSQPELDETKTTADDAVDSRKDSNLKTGDTTEGKQSVTDSGIVSDKCPEDREEIVSRNDVQIDKGGEFVEATGENKSHIHSKWPSYGETEMDLMDNDTNILIDQRIHGEDENVEVYYNPPTHGEDGNVEVPTDQTINVEDRNVEVPNMSSVYTARLNTDVNADSNHDKNEHEQKRKKKRRKRRSNKINSHDSFSCQTPDTVTLRRHSAIVTSAWLLEKPGDEEFVGGLAPLGRRRVVRSAGNSPCRKDQTFDLFEGRRTSWHDDGQMY